MRDKPLVSCLTATYGRYTVLCEAVSCFLEQTYKNKELIILNNHESKLYCDLPQITIYNEPGYPTLGHCRNRLLELANGKYVRTWDDDDLYLPWAIEQGIANIGKACAFKPKFSWDSRKNEKYNLGENVYEASVTFRKDFVEKYKYFEGGGDEHNPIMIGLTNEKSCKVEDVHPSYCYRWDSGLFRISGTLGNGTPIEERTENWMDANQDIDSDNLQKVDLSKYWKDIKKVEKKVNRKWPDFNV